MSFWETAILVDVNRNLVASTVNTASVSVLIVKRSNFTPKQSSPCDVIEINRYLDYVYTTPERKSDGII